METSQKALSPEQVEKIYCLSKGTLANLRCAKKGPKYYKVGRKVLYFIEDLEMWLKQSPVLTSDSIESIQDAYF